jgi:hypothetical protein
MGLPLLSTTVVIIYVRANNILSVYRDHAKQLVILRAKESIVRNHHVGK